MNFNIDIFSIISTVVVPILLVYIRTAKTKQDETIAAISKQNGHLDAITSILNAVVDSQSQVKEALINDNTRLAVIETKIDGLKK